jgi:hypothetical protein
MKKHTDIASRLFSGITLTLALASAGCGVAVEGDTRPPIPNLNPDVPGYTPDPNGEERLHELGKVLRQTAARGTADGGNADGVHGCDFFPYHHYEHGADPSRTQLHVVGVQTSAATVIGDIRDRGPVTVRLNRAGRSVLMLSAESPVEWNVEVADGATLEGIITNGFYGEGTVNAPEGVPVLSYSLDKDDETFGGYGHEWPSYETSNLIEAAEIVTGLELTSFRGCRASESFDIDEPGPLRPPHTVSPSTEPAIIPGCESLTAESSYCMISDAGALRMMGLDSGTTCGAVSLDIRNSLPGGSLGWMGDYVYTCTGGRGLTRASILDGTVDIAPLPCQGVTVQDDGLLVLLRYGAGDISDQRWFVARFASFEDAVERNAETVYAAGPDARRITADEDRLYFSEFSGDAIEVAALEDGAPFQGLPLAGFDGWIHGMEVIDGELLVSSSGEGEPGHALHVFDAATGAFKRKLDPTSSNPNTWISGIECIGGGAAE